MMITLSRFSAIARPTKGALSSILKCKNSTKSTHFGYQTIPEDEKTEKVLGVFHNVADTYDIMNDVMSAGIHRIWKDHFIKKLDPSPRSKILDVAGGTGDITFRILEHIRGQEGLTPSLDKDSSVNVTCCDINTSMLEVGQKRALNLNLHERIEWQEGDAMKLPFQDDSFDAYTIAFGIRNVTRIEEALSEGYRVLKKGGRFLCLEFSHVPDPLLNSLYEFYSFQVIPPMGKVIAGDWDSYQYLVESIRRFPDQEKFKLMIEDAGFRAVDYEDLTFGVAAIHSGFKL